MPNRLVVMAAIAVCFSSAAFAEDGLTVASISEGFIEGTKICVQSKLSGLSIAQLPKEQRSGIETAEPKDTLFENQSNDAVYHVVAGKGIVAIAEKPDGSCEVVAYGPPIRPLFAATSAALVGPGIGLSETENYETRAGIVRVLQGAGAAGSVEVRLNGGEPGMAGRLFRFPLASAEVRSEAGAR